VDDDQANALFELADVILAVARHIEASKPNRDAGATPLHGAVLRHVDRNPGASVSEVADSTRMLSSNVSRAVRNLVDEGYLRRVADDDDGRRVRLYPTAKADLNRAELGVRWSQLLARADLESRDVRSLNRSLRRLEEGLNRPTDPQQG
jgi:DNA-binding MarR family transcriptional regulator